MKILKLIAIVLFTVTLSVNSFAQMHDHSSMNMATTKTDTLKVAGNCGMCKSRIEKAAKIDGVTKVEWSDETKLLTLTYDPAKVTSDDVQKKIASVGHDTEMVKADDKAYNALPGCCKYRK